MMRMGCLFDQEPLQWGLRGDPYLWSEMKEMLSDRVVPSTKENLIEVITEAFKEITQHEISESEYIHVERFSHGGMSSGMVSPEYWRKTAIPYLWCLIKNEDTGWLF